MNGIINFNKAKKALDRKVQAAKAAENRVKFGRTKAEKSKTEAQRGDTLLDGAKRED
jgi:nucleoid-associated protein YgaU